MGIIRKRINILVMILKEKFLDVKIDFYLSKRKGFLHLGLDKSVTSLECYEELTEEIYNFFSIGLEDKFKVICPPLLVPTVRWKYDYILLKKKKRIIRTTMFPNSFQVI